MKLIKKLILWISNLKVAIGLLVIIAIASGLGTAIPQGEPKPTYLDVYNEHPFLGFINGTILLHLQIDHIYSSVWFLFLLTWLGLALIICSWRRQWPSLKAAMKWIDYKEPHQLSKLALAETVSIDEKEASLSQLASFLEEKGWKVKKKPNRIAARKGVIGRAGPLLVHIGLIFLMIGATWGSLGGQKIERFLAPGRSIDLMSLEGEKQLTLTLKNFKIDRDAAGRTEQFRSKIELSKPNQIQKDIQEISVNHPLRFEGLTVYQADWSLAAITLQIGESPKLQLPLKSFPELGEQIWGLVLPTRPDGTEPVLLTVTNEQGPVEVIDDTGDIIANLIPGGSSTNIKGVPIKVTNLLPASGLLLKRDPGVPLVYIGFTITLIGGVLSIISTRQLWAVADTKKSLLHVGGLCNRNLTGLAQELPIILTTISNK